VPAAVQVPAEVPEQLAALAPEAVPEPLAVLDQLLVQATVKAEKLQKRMSVLLLPAVVPVLTVGAVQHVWQQLAVLAALAVQVAQLAEQLAERLAEQLPEQLAEQVAQLAVLEAVLEPLVVLDQLRVTAAVPEPLVVLELVVALGVAPLPLTHPLWLSEGERPPHLLLALVVQVLERCALSGHAQLLYPGAPLRLGLNSAS